MTVDDATQIAASLRAVEARIEAAARRAGRAPSDVQLLLATKTVPASRVALALRAGDYALGENKVLEGEAKAAELDARGVEAPRGWHVIGHLQTNKVKYALRYARCIESIDRMRLVTRLDRLLEAEGRALDVMLQVNVSGEASKYGVTPEELPAFAREVAQVETLRIRGLMTIGKFGDTPEVARPGFARLRELRDRVLAEGIERCEPRELSMGMSGDLELAIEEGATIIRVGTAVFGARPLPDSYYWPSG